MRSSLLQQPHSTKATVTGGEVTLVGATGGATTTGGNRWNV